MGTHPIFESDFDCLTECLLVKSSTPPGLSSTPQSQLTALLVLTPLPSTPPPRRVVTRLASRPISRTLLVLSTPSPRSLTFSATHASVLPRRSPPFPPLLARLAWPRPLLVFSRLFAKTTEWASSPRSLRSTPESSRPKPVKFQSRSPPLSSSLLNRNPKSPKPLPPCSETRLPSSPLLSTARRHDCRPRRQ